MNLQAFKDQLRELVEENKLKEAFEVFKAGANMADSVKKNAFTNLRRQYNELSLAFMVNGSIGWDTYTQQMSKISSGFLQLVDLIEAEELGAPTAAAHAPIANPLLLVGHSPESEQRIRELYLALHFTEVQVVSTGLMEQKMNLDPYDLLVFDNTDLPVCRNEHQLDQLSQAQQQLIRDRIAVMQAVIDHSSKFIVHYGDILFWVNQHRNRVHAGNSPFALYARTREVLEFINTYRV